MAAESWTPDKDWKSRRAYVIRIAKELLSLKPSDAAQKKIQRRMLDRCIWQWTIASARNGKKYDLQYVSRNSLQLLNSGDRKSLRHEHVIERKSLVNQLLKSPRRARAILEESVACIVTNAEHRELHGQESGWARYREARVAVVDRTTGKLVPIKKLISEFER